MTSKVESVTFLQDCHLERQLAFEIFVTSSPVHEPRHLIVNQTTQSNSDEESMCVLNHIRDFVCQNESQKQQADRKNAISGTLHIFT